MVQTKDVVVMGAGPAGMTAGLYSARAGLTTVVLDIKTPGGQILLTDPIFNYPGFPDGIAGRKPAHLFQLQAERYGCQVASHAVSVRLTADQGVRDVSTTKDHRETKTVIAATGGTPRRLNTPEEKKFSDSGDVRGEMAKQMLTAVGDRALAALAAERYLPMQSCLPCDVAAK